MSYALNHNIGAFLRAAFARIPAVITAGAGNDGVEISGPYVDRKDASGRLAGSVTVLIPFSATLQATETLTLAANIQDDAAGDGAVVADYGSATSGKGGGSEILASAVVATGPGGGGTVTGCAKFDVDLDGAKRYIRLQVTANLSASGTDTVALAGVFVFGAGEELPHG